MDINFDKTIDIAEFLLANRTGTTISMQEIHLPVMNQIHIRGGTIKSKILVIFPCGVCEVNRFSQNRETEIRRPDCAGVGGGSGQPFFLRGNGRPFQYAGFMRHTFGNTGDRDPDPLIDIILRGICSIAGIEREVCRLYKW